MNKWTSKGKDLVEQLKIIDSEEVIKQVCLALIKEIKDTYEKENSRKNPLSNIRKEVLNAYPDTENVEYPLQYFTDSGKGNVPRYSHLALKYLTLNPDKSVSNQKQIELIINMNNEQKTIELPIEAQQAMQQLDIEAEELINRALIFYSKSILGKAKRHDEDLSGIATEDLLKDEKYSTHPKRVYELTKRAIKAIKIHNSEIATENNNRWFISQSAISRLIGSRASAIKKVLENFATDINETNNKYELHDYSNRKKDGSTIEEKIDLVKLVPDGI